MSEKFNWDDEEFRDMPEEVGGQDAPPVSPTRSSSSAAPPASTIVSGYWHPEEVQTLSEAISDEEEEDYSDVLSDARLRLEQGRLYEMVMNHNLFEGLEADPKAVRRVQKEIRKFAKERMEVMLGMRSESIGEPPVSFSSPFNSLEIEILKKLASAASKGATESPNAEAYANTPKREGLAPINKPAASRQQAGPVKKSLPKAPDSPLSRVKKETREAILREEGVPAALLEEDYEPLTKHPSLLTNKEKAKRFEETQKRLAAKRTAKNKNALPQPTAAQEEMLYRQRVAEVSPAISGIISLLNTKK